MKRGNGVITSILLIAAFDAVMLISATGLAQAQSVDKSSSSSSLGSTTITTTTTTTTSPQNYGQDIEKCWKSIASITGCITDIARSILKGDLVPGSPCCRTIIGIEKNCLEKVFPVPLIPFIPDLLNRVCTDAKFASTLGISLLKEDKQ